MHILIVCLVLLIVGTTIVSSLDFEKKTIDYKKIEIYDLLIESNETNDRDDYWTLNNIILNFMKFQVRITKISLIYLLIQL